MQNTYSVLHLVYLVIHLAKVEKSISKFDNEQMSKLICRFVNELICRFELTNGLVYEEQIFLAFSFKLLTFSQENSFYTYYLRRPLYVFLNN